MLKLATTKLMRELDRAAVEECGVPGIVLMENAGAGCAGMILDYLMDEAMAGVCVVCGPGNNGGDGFVIARHLWNTGLDVEIYILGDPKKYKGDAKINLEILEKYGLPINNVSNEDEFDILCEELMASGLVVDAVFGTGLDREVAGLFFEIIDAINESGTPVFSVDIPSGLNSDNGQPMPIAVFADFTGTFGMPKVGQFTYPGYLYCGEIQTIDISIPGFLIDEADADAGIAEPFDFYQMFESRNNESHKGGFGHVGVIGGFPGMTGAPAFSSLAALRTGAGLCTLGVPENLNLAMEAKLLDVITRPLPTGGKKGLGIPSLKEAREMLKGKNVLALGPGMGQSPAAAKFVKELLGDLDIPAVIDADGLNNLAGQVDILDTRRAETILTPHPGEMSRLTGLSTQEIQANRIEVAVSFAQKHDVYVVLKGARSVIATPEGKTWINITGNPGMATAGSGDILTGIIAGLIAQGFPILESLMAGTYLHGFAGDIALETKTEKGMIASDILDKLPEAIKSIEMFLTGELEESEDVVDFGPDLDE